MRGLPSVSASLVSRGDTVYMSEVSTEEYNCMRVPGCTLLLLLHMCVCEFLFHLSQQTLSIINRLFLSAVLWINENVCCCLRGINDREDTTGYCVSSREQLVLISSLHWQICLFASDHPMSLCACQVGLRGPCWGVGLQVPPVLPKEPAVSPGSTEPRILQQPSSTALGAAGQYVIQ